MAETIDEKNEQQRRVLWIVLLLNLAIAIGFFVTGAIGDSSGLIANGLDNTSDTVVYAISLFAVSRAGKWKRAAANVSGGMLLLFAVGVLVDAGEPVQLRQSRALPEGCVKLRYLADGQPRVLIRAACDVVPDPPVPEVF